MKLLCLLILTLLAQACKNPLKVAGTGNSGNGVRSTGIGANQALVLKVNPAVSSGDLNISASIDIADYISSDPVLITDKNELDADCVFTQELMGNLGSVEDCIRVYSMSDQESRIGKASDGTWYKESSTKDFEQVTTFYHANLFKDSFLSWLNLSQTLLSFAISKPSSAPSVNTNYITNNSYWFEESLKIYANCDFKNNAYFDPAKKEVCLGYIQSGKVTIAQDPSVVYHELGHAAVSIMMNQRNRGLSIPYESHLSGNGGYDEGRAINEGLADYFSFMMNNRTKLGEWALGAEINAARPLTEEDSLHKIGGISSNSHERLRYPQYLFYNPNSPTEASEAAHNGGQIVSHFLYQLTMDFKDQCFANLDSNTALENAKIYTFGMINETLAELGDLSTTQSDLNNTGVPFVNMSSDSAYTFAQLTKRITYKRFFQTFARKTVNFVLNSFRCGADKSILEQRLDQYGLLLFDDYDQNFSSYDTDSDQSKAMTDFNETIYPPLLSTVVVDTQGLNGASIEVDPLNRNNSVLLAKSLIRLPTENESRSRILISDTRSSVLAIINSLKFQGAPLDLSSEVVSTDYLNNNNAISPGEIVAISPNIINESNSEIAGVTVLGTDWDHMKRVDIVDDTKADLLPCIFNSFPSVSEGGVASESDSSVEGNCDSESKDGKRFVIDTNLHYPKDANHPICLVELEGENETRWVSQAEFIESEIPDIYLNQNDCLAKDHSGGQNLNECLARFVPGADSVSFSKISPGKTWIETYLNETTAESGEPIRASAFMLLEINKNVPPGTKFVCRLRADFSNCADCGDTHPDYKYNGAEPFQVLDFQFTVSE